MNGQGFLSGSQARLFTLAAVVGAVLVALTVPLSLTHAWGNLLIASVYLTTLGLGGAMFVAFGYVTGAGWNVAFRRVPEAMAVTLVACGVISVGVLALGMHNYAWHAHGEAGTFWFKQMWLSPQFWLVRAVGYLALWSVLSMLIVSLSRRQDRVGGTRLTIANGKLSALFLAVSAVTFSLACFDWLMALTPMWYSTVFAAYQFAGMMQATLATMILIGLALRAPGRPLHGVFTTEHLHDLAKLLLGFSCFWMYLWFSQFMLIWYTDIPEEVAFFVPRESGAWGAVTGMNIFLNWLLPFFVLLPRPSKRSGKIAARVAGAVLLGRWLDLYWIVIPALHQAHPDSGNPLVGVAEAGSILLVLGLFTLLVSRTFGKANPVPRQDPLLQESLHYHL